MDKTKQKGEKIAGQTASQCRLTLIFGPFSNMLLNGSFENNWTRNE